MLLSGVDVVTLAIPESPEDLAATLRVPMPKLRWLTSRSARATGKHYSRWGIEKRDGSERTITAPRKHLKTAQRAMLRRVLTGLYTHPAAHGFVPSRSTATHAAVHSGAAVLITADIANFFPTVHWRRVRNLYRRAGLDAAGSAVAARLVTEPPRETVKTAQGTRAVETGEPCLPQGAPTSPAITNILCVHLDRRLSGLARALGFRFSRYADDLAFSWRPSPEHSRPKAGRLIAQCRAVLRAEGFVMHPAKTDLVGCGRRMMVTGLVVNAAPGCPPARVPREARRRVRAALHNYERGLPVTLSLEELRGWAAYIHMTNPREGAALLSRVDRLEGKR